jgi:hypothetical protein
MIANDITWRMRVACWISKVTRTHVHEHVHAPGPHINIEARARLRTEK